MVSPARPSAVRRRAWRSPQWPWVALVGAAWIGLVVASAGAHSPGSWALMVVAMMVPATIPLLRAISFESMWHRRYRSPTLFLAAYLSVWLAVGVAALALWQLSALAGGGHALHGAVLTGAILVVAANWQLAPTHRRCLKRSHRTLPLGSRGRAADRACLRYGAYHGRQCIGACWPLMLAMVPGHSLALMVALTAFSTWQRLDRRPSRPVSAGALLVLAAVVVMAG